MTGEAKGGNIGVRLTAGQHCAYQFHGLGSETGEVEMRVGTPQAWLVPVFGENGGLCEGFDWEEREYMVEYIFW